MRNEITAKQFNSANLSVETDNSMLKIDNTAFGFGHDWYKQYPEKIVERYYHSYPMTVSGIRYEDNYKKAFKIAKKLLAKKLLNSRKLVDFIALVEMIVEDM